MAGVSEMPFRVLAFRMGAGLCTTELVSAQGLFRVNARSLRYLKHDEVVESPYSLQIFGGVPEVMARAAVTGKQWGAHIIDINMGCPVKKVTKTGAGSGLLCDVPRAADLIRQVREATGLPVTAKIRLGWDDATKNYLDVADALGAAGVAALAMHPRTRAQGYAGKADWSAIARLVRHVNGAFPVIGNGDVLSPADAHRMAETTGCDAVMIGRGALGNPWIFRELTGGLPPTAEERATVILQHLREQISFLGNEELAVRTFRKHLSWYSKGLLGAAGFRATVNQLVHAADVERAVGEFFGASTPDEGVPEEYDVDYRQALG